MQRRQFIKNALAANLLLALQFVSPQLAAKISRDTFQDTSSEVVVSTILGEVEAEESDKITIKAPETAENGAIVPLEVTSDIEGSQRIVLVVVNNPTPLAGEFIFGEGIQANVKVRCKIGKTSDVIALVGAGDKIYTKKVEVKVTKGGC